MEATVRRECHKLEVLLAGVVGVQDPAKLPATLPQLLDPGGFELLPQAVAVVLWPNI